MAATGRATVVGVFDDRTHAEQALDALRQAGFREDQLGLAVRGGEAVEPPPLDPGTKEGEGAVLGAVAGGTVGGLVGAALAVVVIPGIGLVVAGGLLAGLLGGLATGAVGGGILGTLVGLDLPEEQARHAERHFHSGRTLVIVRAEARADEAAALLLRHGGHGGTLPPGSVAAEEAEEHPTGRASVARLEDGGGDVGSGTVFPGA